MFVAPTHPYPYSHSQRKGQVHGNKVFAGFQGVLGTAGVFGSLGFHGPGRPPGDIAWAVGSRAPRTGHVPMRPSATVQHGLPAHRCFSGCNVSLDVYADIQWLCGVWPTLGSSVTRTYRKRMVGVKLQRFHRRIVAKEEKTY